jgi:hypothetical protein
MFTARALDSSFAGSTRESISKQVLFRSDGLPDQVRR